MVRTRNKPKQTRLSFAPVGLATDGDSTIGGKADRLAKVRYGHPSAPSLVDQRPTSYRDTKKSGKSRKRKDLPDINRQKSPEVMLTSSNIKREHEESDDEGIPAEGSSRERNNTSNIKREPEESDNEDIATDNSSHGRNNTEESDENEIITKPSFQTKCDTSERDDEIITNPGGKLRRGAAPKPAIELDSDSEEEPVASSPAKRRKRNMASDILQTPRRNSNQHNIDLEEDLEDLRDSVVKETRTRGRLADSARAKRQQHLETLRRRRAGHKDTAVESLSDSEMASKESESESEDGPAESPVHQATLRHQEEDSDVESMIVANEDLDKDDEEFVLADEDGELGVPTGSDDIPLEFTRHAYKQPKDYFQDAVEWMVHNQLNPAFPRTGNRFSFAFGKLENEVKGRAGSQLVSSAWNANFRRAVMARPHIEVTLRSCDGYSCDACNRSGHPATSEVKFYGKAYSMDTLEPLVDEDSGEEQQSDDDRERDRDGNILPDEGTRYLLGKHCRNMATMAHTLVHWRFHLNEWVIDYLRYKGILDDTEILQRGPWSQLRKSKFADDTLVMMIETGEIQKLWRDFHINLKVARESTSGA